MKNPTPIIFVVLCLMMLSCNNKNSNKVESYQKKVMDVEETERAVPEEFLSVRYSYNENLMGEAIKIRCEITNKATVATYKDVVLKIVYYSKTNSIIGSVEQTVYENFPPHETIKTKLKVPAIPDAESIQIEVVSAKAV